MAIKDISNWTSVNFYIWNAYESFSLSGFGKDSTKDMCKSESMQGGIGGR